MCLEINQIVRSYRPPGVRSTPKKVLSGVDLTLKPGEIIGITGNSGAGKTTLGLILAGILQPDNGKVHLAGTDLWASDTAIRKRISRKLQMVFQHPESTFDPRWTMQQSLSEPFRLSGIRPDFSLLTDRLAEVELDSTVLIRRPHQLSGGELQRIAIARILALNPAVVVLDEPTAMLDVLTQARIMNLLERIRQRTGVSYVLISHDGALVHKFCPRVFRLEHGRLLSQ
jgi:peptide/nickel transport system ATP-binding protein